jgi:hypothetical protein
MPWVNKTGQSFETTRELVYHLHKDEKAKEVEHYCTQCKETTPHLFIKKWGQYQCLECGQSYFA